MKACQQLLSVQSLTLYVNQTHRYKWLGHGTKRYLTAWHTSPCAQRLWFITRNILTCGRFGACTPASMKVSSWPATKTQQYFVALLFHQQAGSLSSWGWHLLQGGITASPTPQHSSRWQGRALLPMPCSRPTGTKSGCQEGFSAAPLSDLAA